MFSGQVTNVAFSPWMLAVVCTKVLIVVSDRFFWQWYSHLLQSILVLMFWRDFSSQINGAYSHLLQMSFMVFQVFWFFFLPYFVLTRYQTVHLATPRGFVISLINVLFFFSLLMFIFIWWDLLGHHVGSSSQTVSESQVNTWHQFWTFYLLHLTLSMTWTTPGHLIIFSQMSKHLWALKMEVLCLKWM